MSLTIESTLHFRRQGRGARRVITLTPPMPAGRIPRVARLLALAHHLDDLVRRGALKDFAEIARLGHVTRARVSQVMNLIHLAPDIQEQVLFLPAVEHGRDPLVLRQLQPIAIELDWARQRQLWDDLLRVADQDPASAK